MSMSGPESDLSTITVCKRDGVTKQPFQEEKIRKALTKAWVATQGQPDEKVINRVMNTVLASFADTEVSVEDIQDLVETVLMKHKQFAVAKTYILYRQKQAELRGLPKLSPDPKALSDYIHAGKYARHRPEFGRREVYAETTARGEDMHIRKFPALEGQIREAFKHVYAKHLLPSMRSMQFGGAAIEQNNARIFNCSFSHVDRMEVFAEAMYLLLAGCGTGYSVQFEHVEKLPPIPYINKDDVRHHVVQDTIEGWADAVRALTTGFLDKKYVEFSFHLVRPAGAALKTSGGRAPGHLKLKETLERMRAVLEGAQGRQLRPIECHRMLCHGADAVLSGGIRRCLPKGTLIHAERGLIPIESVTVGDKVRTSGVGHDAWSTVSDVLEQGIQTLVHVKTQMGTFKCTAKHQIAVLTSPDSYEFKMAQDLEEGDRLVFVDHIVPGKATSLPAWSYSRREAAHTSTDITVPTLDKDVAWFIGYLHGNGYVHVNRIHADGGSNFVAISMNSTDAIAPELARRIQDVFSRFGVESAVRTTKGENTQVVRASGKQLALYMENFKTPNTALQVPDFILEGTAEIRAAYLAGLFDSDGAANNRPVILVASVYPEFLKQVQAVYASLGIPTRLVQNREAQGKWKAIYHLNLVGELPKVRFQSIVETFTAKTTQISLQSRMDYGYSSNWIVGSDLNYTNKWAPNSKQMTVGTFDRCGGVRKGLTPITVTDVIETDETAETFDLTVEGAHEFVAEGLLVHNSASICLFSLDDSEMLYAKTGKWYVTDPWFANANNSVVLKRDEVKKKQFKRIFKMIKEWGEPGFYFTEDFNYGTNPCSEIGLYPLLTVTEVDLKVLESRGVKAKVGDVLSGWAFCNLCEINASRLTSLEEFLEVAKAATFIGTLQATYTDMPYLGIVTEEIARRDALLGISMTGVMGSPIALDPECQRTVALAMVEWNKEFAALLGINQAARVGAVKPAGCRPYNALVTTDKGILTLEELFADHPANSEWAPIKTDIKAVQGKDASTLTRSFDNGEAEVIELEMNFGLSVRSTLNHPWFVTRHMSDRWAEEKPVMKWVETKDIRPGDVLEINTRAYRQEHSYKFEDVNTRALTMRSAAFVMKQPKEMDDDLAWLVGYIWGDGAQSVSHYRLRFTDGFEPSIRKAAAILKDKFGIESTVNRLDNKEAFLLEVGCKHLYLWMIRNNMEKYAEATTLDNVPACIRHSSWKHVVSFAAGLLDSDGAVAKPKFGGATITISSATAEFARNFQNIMWTVGLGLGRSLQSKGKSFQQERRLYHMTLSASGTQLDAFTHLRSVSEKCKKYETVEGRLPWCVDIAPGAGRRVPGKVKTVRSLGVLPTFDVEVEGTHWFYDGSVKSHNTTSLELGGVSSGIHPFHSRRYIRRVTADALEVIFQAFKEVNPHMCVRKPDGKWVIEFAVEAPPNAVTREDLSAIEFLKIVQSTQQNWVVPSTARPEAAPGLTHNVSNTVTVKPDEWDAVCDYIWANRAFFTGVSLLASTGDKDYAFAPHEAITTPADEARWNAILASYKPVNYEDIFELGDDTNLSGEVACAGGACNV